MKEYQKKLKEYDPAHTVFLEHRWGQNAESLYNQIVPLWNALAVGDALVIASNKNHGLKSALKFLQERGVSCEIVGKGPNEARLVECKKSDAAPLRSSAPLRVVEFASNGNTYKANIGNAIFSKEGLDKGSKFLLETIFALGFDFNNREVADFGAGWGALPLVLQREFPKAIITAYEIDPASCEAARENLKDTSATVVCLDLFQALPPPIEHHFDYIVANPPFHITPEERKQLFLNAARALKGGGELCFVVEQPFAARFRKSAELFFGTVSLIEGPQYAVFRCAASRSI